MGCSTVTGGMAADGARFQRTWVLHEGQPKAGMVIALGFYGEKFHMKHGARGGWEASELAMEDVDSRGPMLAVAVSCVGRRLVLGEHVEDETEAMLRHFPVGTRQVGFYGYGGISPYSTGSCDFHNQTMMLTTLKEA